jgi:hypothetical protein
MTVRKFDRVVKDRFVSYISALQGVTGSDGFDCVPDDQKPAFLAALDAPLAFVPKKAPRQVAAPTSGFLPEEIDALLLLTEALVEQTARKRLAELAQERA